MKHIGMIKEEELSEHHRQYLDAKRKEFEGRNGGGSVDGESSFPKQAVLCAKCQTKAMVLMDGCMTCLNCGDSKCG